MTGRGSIPPAGTTDFKVVREILRFPRNHRVTLPHREREEGAQFFWGGAAAPRDHFLCRLATGSGFATRMLYTDDEEQLFQASRPILMNGIDGTVTRGDLLDRSLVVYLPIISEQQRKPENDFWRDFRKAQGRILGKLFDAVSCASRRLKEVKLDRLPRMADFARWASAAEPALGWADGTLMSAYDANRASANTLTLDASPLVLPLRHVIAVRDVWRGTDSDLLLALARQAAESDLQQRNWPKNPQVLSGQLRRIAPNLRATGIDVQLDEKTSGSGSQRMVTIRRTLHSASSATPLRFPRLKSDASDARDAKTR